MAIDATMPKDTYPALACQAEVCSVIGLLANSVHTKASTMAATRCGRA
jgi:hypothetical protein